MSALFKEQLIEILIKTKILTSEQLNQALEVQKEKGGRLSNILVSLKLVNEKDLMLALSKSLQIPPINLGKIKIDPEVIKIIPEHVAKHYQLIPISHIGNNLTVAMSDPLNIFALDDIHVLTNYKVKTVLSTEEDIKEAIRAYYSKSAGELLEDAIKEKKIKVLSPPELKEQMDIKTLMEKVNEAPIVKITDLLLAEGIKRGASDILIEPLEKIMQVRYRIDGILQMGETPPKSMHEMIVTRIKVMSKLNVAEHRLPQDGRLKISFPGKDVDFRISVLPSTFGEKLALRILDKSALLLDIEKLGFEEEAIKTLKECAGEPHGMLLICGPTGCGKTTTLYSILNFIDSIEKNLITVEDPVEYQLDGINQVTALPEIGLTFASALRSILRQDPDIIMVGEIRDFETVDIAIKAALTGHLVLSTLHTTDAAASIVRLVNMGVEPFLITASTLMIGAQRLVRLLCPACKEAYSPAAAIQEKLRLKEGGKNTFYRPRGCKKCNNTGYKGRIGIIEALKITSGIKELIMKKAPEAEIKRFARQQGMRSMRENGIIKAIRGETSLEEIIKVTVEDEKLK
ncbi:MAG: ATPase, T2SS/T4P/T4SS family [Candidatus Omnitrophota bacterium]